MKALQRSARALACVFAAAGCWVTAACGGEESGTYYKYKDGEYVKSDYYVLESGKKWRDSKMRISGTYTLSGETIVFYTVFLGSSTVYSEGTVSDGVMELYGEFYCKEGKAPAEKAPAET
ncbi:MAG: hypothetical protein ACI4SH_03465 [Candidatus Scatosoma sp.]